MRKKEGDLKLGRTKKMFGIWKRCSSPKTSYLSHLCRSKCLLIISACQPLLLFLFLLTAHTHSKYEAADPAVPLWSSNMQWGHRWLKHVAGGLHFETINRPPGTESNTKRSISVSLGSWWHQGKGCAEGERADSTSVSSSNTVALCWKTVELLWWNSNSLMWFQGGFVYSLSWPWSLWPGWDWGLEE